MALVNQEPVAIIQEVGSPGSWLNVWELPPHVTWVARVSDLPSQSFRAVLWITDRLVEDGYGLDTERILWFRPPSVVLGVGCERGIPLAALEDGLEHFLRQAGYARASITALASLDRKADETAMVELAQRSGWQTFFYGAGELAQVTGIARPCWLVERCVGTPGVAEPAALLAAQAQRLLAEKQVVASTLAPQRMTFALARLATVEDSPPALGKVIFIGAGPGDPELLTLKGRRLLAQADVVIYAGSLIPEAVLQYAPATATIHNSAPLTLEQVMEIMLTAVQAGKQVGRLQSGDLSSTVPSRSRWPCWMMPASTMRPCPASVPFKAAAAALHSESDHPRGGADDYSDPWEGKTKMPDGESLAALAAHRASLCIFLSARLSRAIQEQLLTAYAPETPVAILYRVSWPDEKIIVTRLQDLHSEIRKHKLTRTTLILVGEAIGSRKNRSRLYHTTHAHIFRRRGRARKSPPA